MKTRINVFLFSVAALIVFSFSYYNPGQLRVNFVHQNPKYFPDAVSYFLVEGMADKSLQQVVNDSLRKWYTAKSGFFRPSKGMKLPDPWDHREIKKGKTLWLYPALCNAPSDSVRGFTFRDCDTLVRMGAFGYEGSGAATCTWSCSIQRNQLLLISLEYDPAKIKGPASDPLIMDLRTAKRLEPQITIRFQKEKLDSLHDYLRQQAEKKYKQEYQYQSVTATPLFSDTILHLSQWEVCAILCGQPIPVFLPCLISGIAKNGTAVSFKDSLIFSLAELSPFTNKDYPEQIEAVYE